MIVETNGAWLYYDEHGAGLPLVLIHGIGNSTASWDGVVSRLAEAYRVITWDVRGFGRSDKPPGPYSAELWAKDLAAILDALAIERAAVLGHSMGGVIAQRFALDFPQRLLALILESTSSQVGEKARQYWLGEAASSDSPAFASAARAVAAINFTADLHQITVPTLILQGLTDVRTPPGGSVIMSRNIPGARLEMIEDTGHSIHGERPERFVSLVTQFLAAVQADGHAAADSNR